MVKLKAPVIPAAAAEMKADQIQQPARGSTARFIMQGDSRPSRRAQPTNFRLPAELISLLEEEAMNTGQNKTTILKAAIIAYCTSLDQNEKNRWLLEAPKY